MVSFDLMNAPDSHQALMNSIEPAMFESLPDGVVVTSATGLIVRVNAGSERLFCYTRDELVGQPIELLVPQRFRSSHMAERAGFHQQPHMRPMGAGLDLHAQRKDGTEFPVDIMLSPVRMNGEVLVIAVVRDITQRKQAEEALRDSRAMLEQLFESSPDAIILLTSLEGRIVRVNAQAEKGSGYRRDELVGQPIEVLIAPRSRDPHGLGRLTYRAEDSERDANRMLELYVRRKNGEEFPVEITLNPVENRDGEFVLAVVRDITSRKQAEDALRRSEHLFRSLVKGVKDYAIFMLDPDGRVVSWNEGAERINGYRAEEIIGQHFSRFYLPEDAERGKPEEGLKIAAGRGRSEDEGWRVRKDGSRFWANVILSTLRDQNDQIIGFSKVARDLTQRRRAEEALLLEITNALVSNLDIRNLLQAIAASIRQVMPYDYASLALPEPETSKLRIHLLDFPKGNKSGNEGWMVPIEGSPAGRAFTTHEPVVLNRMDAGQFDPEVIQRWTSLGIKSGCWLPLVSHGRVLGTLIVASEREDAFRAKDVTLLGQVANQVAIAIDNAAAFRQIAELKDRLAEEKQYLEDELRTEYNFEEIIGESPALKRVLKQVETVAPTDSTVLIRGETGTGKELIARAVHHLSARCERTFVKLNCSAIPGGLLESELFGHERGAFTGAIAQKMGRLEIAHRGTFFLDEVGDLPLELQPKLLRALQEKEFERVGGTRTIPVDIRLVAATNQNLEELVKERQFRSDLYYRLKVFPVTIPPLRERPEDIPLLAHYFTQKHSKRMNKRIERIPPETLQALVRWRWPGNVRELENLIERAVILSRGPELKVPLAEIPSAAEPEPADHSTTTLEAAERDHILRVLKETKGVIGGPKGAAAKLGLKRTTLNFKMRKLGLSRLDL